MTMVIKYDYEPTDEQKKAINCLDRDVAVVAGAGAGKTRVLIYRILNIVLQGKADFSNIVAITFTEKAAAEMKVKLRKEARRQMELNPLLKSRLSKAPLTTISTIHGFCANLIRRYALKIGYVPEFAVLDQDDASRLLIKAISEVLEENENADDRIFIRFKARSYSLKENLEAAYNKIREFGYTVSEALEISLKSLEWAEEQAKKNLEAFNEIMKYAYSKHNIADKRTRFVKELLPKWPEVEPVFRRLESQEELTAEGKKAIVDYLASIKGITSVSATFDEYKEVILKGAQTIPFLFTVADQREVVEKFASLLEQIDARYTKLKQEAASLDFTDLQLKALEILKHPDVKEQLQKEYRYIMIDEYQDTNYLQQQIVDEIWQEGVNLFIVGDPKQSIYRFRGAEVALFEDTSSRIRKKGGENVTLTFNFRSNKTLIDFYNSFFANYMPGDPSKPYAIGYEAARNFHHNPDEKALNIIACNYDEKAEPEKLPPKLWQARVISRLIKEAVESGEAEYRDFAVLFSKRSSGLSELEEEFARFGIPFTSGHSQNFFQREEIRECLSLIEFLNNPTDDLSLAACLKGPFFSFSDEEIYRIMALKKELQCSSLYAAILGCGGAGFYVQKERQRFGIQQTAGNNLQDLAEHLAELCTYYGYMSLSDILHEAIKKTQFNLILLAQTMGRERLANVEKLLEIISQEVQKGRSNNEIVEVLRIQQEKAVPDAQVVLEDQNRVAVMTIHGAKGLEFKHVIVAGLTDFEGRSGNSAHFDFHKEMGLMVSLPSPLPELGVSVPCADPRYFSYLEKEKDEESYEDQRLLYVAFTRARERLHLVFAGKIITKKGEYANGIVKMFDWNFLAQKVWFKDLELSFPEYEYANFDAKRKVLLPEVKIAEAHLRPRYRALSPSALVQFDMCPRLFYLEQRLKVPSRELIASTDFTQLELDFSYEDELPPAEGTPDKATIGTIFHEIFASAENLEEALEFLRESGYDNLEENYITILENFFRSRFFQSKGESEVPLSWYLPEKNLRLIGFADKVIVEPELVTVVDFKTQTQGDFPKIAQGYEMQLTVYAKALEASLKRPVRAYIYFPYPDLEHEIDTRAAQSRLDAVLDEINKVLDERSLPEPGNNCAANCRYYSLCRG